jgi:4-amino-4-deoxy-L-arabinose transferase-like glycosyltransferase
MLGFPGPAFVILGVYSMPARPRRPSRSSDSVVRSAARRDKADKPLPAWLRALAGPSMAIAVLATLVVLWTLAPNGAGPGATCDEPYYLLKGKSYVSAWNRLGWRLLRAEHRNRVFGFRVGGPPPHPPLGAWILGWTQHAFDPAPRDPLAIALVGGRFAPAMAFGCMVCLVGSWMSRVAGQWAGIAAAVSLALMPRVFGHAHLAALDTFTAVSFLAALSAVSAAVRRGARPWHMIPAGIVWGVALLIKINGVLALAPVVMWLAWKLRTRAPLAILVWGLAGLATLVAGWPWLWTDTTDRLAAYLGSGVDRITLHNWYLGQAWNDRLVPWHYPWVMFAVTVPVGLLLIGGWGLWTWLRTRDWDSDLSLIAGGWLVNLLLFSLPGIPVYDGVRLFLPAYPLFACFVGLGADRLFAAPRLARLPLVWRAVGLSALLATQATGLILMHPFQLSYYNAMVGGLWGAERLGFEPTYWGDTMNGPIVAKAAEFSQAGELLFGPNLAPFQVIGIAASQPSLVEREVDLIGWDASQPQMAAGCRYALIYRRQADMDQVKFVLDHGQVIAESARQGVWLTRVYRLPASPQELLVRPLPPAEGSP